MVPLRLPTLLFVPGGAVVDCGFRRGGFMRARREREEREAADGTPEEVAVLIAVCEYFEHSNLPQRVSRRSVSRLGTLRIILSQISTILDFLYAKEKG